jgi:hypothetical protein
MALEFPEGLNDNEIPEVDEVPVDSKAKESIEDDVTKKFFNVTFQLADEVRSPRETIWHKAWQLYNGQYDWSAKADWQSKTNIPKVRDAVDRASATFRRALVRIKRFFGIESETKLGIQKGLFTISLLDYWLDRVGFIHEFTTGLKAGLITSTIIFKVWWKYESEVDLQVEDEIKFNAVTDANGEVTDNVPSRVVKTTRGTKMVGKLGLKAVDPFKFWIVPNTNQQAVIEKTEASLADIVALAKAGIYEQAAVDAIITGRNKKMEDASEEARRAGENLATQSAHVKPVELFHYWGDMVDEDGNVIMRNATFTMAGRDIVLRKPRSNPFFHGKAPYVFGTPYVVPFSTYNRGIVEDVIGIAGMITELSNLVVDGAHFDAIRAYQVDVDQLQNQREIADGIYPGKTLRYNGLENPSGKQAVQPIEVGQVPASVMGVLDFLDREYQVSTSVTELISGQQGRGARTATEVVAKGGAAQEGLDDAARTVEETVINPLLWMVAATIYQYHDDYQMPRLVENFPGAARVLAEMTPEERYVQMVGGFKVKSKGISVMLDRAQSLEKVTQFMTLVANIPGVLTRLNIDAILEEIVVSLGWNPQKMLVNEATPPVVPAATGPGAASQGGGPLPEAQLPGANTQTPQEISSGQQGALLGGDPNTTSR